MRFGPLLALSLGCGPAPVSPAGTCEEPAVQGEVGRMVGFTEAHNAVRRHVGVPDLVWDDGLALAAQGWLAHLVAERDCALEHDLSSPLGENLAWNRGFESNPCRVVWGWGREHASYDPETGACDGSCGHFTQLVWSTTERLGCALDVCDDGAEIWMCTYDPPGNVPGVPAY